MSQTACNFSPSTVFLQAWLTKDSFPQRGFMFSKATSFLEHKVVLWLGSCRICFPHWGFTFPREHWFSNRGGEWHEPSIYMSLYVGKFLNMALYQDTRVVLFLLYSTEEVRKKLDIIFWETQYSRYLLVQYSYPETHIQKWETFWYNKIHHQLDQLRNVFSLATDMTCSQILWEYVLNCKWIWL